MSEIKIDIIYPVNEVIKQHVDYYYILNPNKECLANSYSAYPSINNPVIFFEDTKVSVNENHHFLQFNRKVPYFCAVLGRFISPVEVTLTGNIRTINIIFKSVGLNAFINKPYANLIKNIYQPFNVWQTDKSFIATLFSLSHQQLVERLDEMLLNNFTPFINEHLVNAISLMKSDKRNYEIKDIEQLLPINRKALFRLFKVNTGISPTAFRRIIRFRQALEKNRNNDLSLTQLAYETNFTDQSHFIKELRKLTGDKPSAFIKNAAYVNGSKFLISQHI